MNRKKYLIVSGISLAVITLASGGFWLANRNDPKTVRKKANSSGPSQNVIPLGGERNEKSTGGLRVNAGGASSLGQLNSSSNTGTDSSSKSGDTASPSKAQLAEFEKYKNSEHALFGEIKAGTGTELIGGKTAAINYKAWLTNGQLFDQSPTNSDGSLQPFLFTLGAHSVIPGLEEGAHGMKVGGTRLIIIPPAVGYGAQGKGPVPGNAVMVFQVQLLQVQ